MRAALLYCKEKSAVKIFLFLLFFFLKKSIMCTVLILVKMPFGVFILLVSFETQDAMFYCPLIIRVLQWPHGGEREISFPDECQFEMHLKSRIRAYLCRG